MYLKKYSCKIFYKQTTIFLLLFITNYNMPTIPFYISFSFINRDLFHILKSSFKTEIALYISLNLAITLIDSFFEKKKTCMIFLTLNI